MSHTALLYDDVFLGHDTGDGHPERSARLRAIMDRIQAGALSSALMRIEATREVTDEDVERVHEKTYWHHVLQRLDAAPAVLDAGDTVVSRGSLQAIFRAAGAGLELADAIMDGRVRNGLALIRPPGHHAERNRAMGFCVVNNIAVVAQYLRTRHQLDRVTIIDFDVHHGNGTQNAFYGDPNVHYVSLHQFPFYPGTGRADERGSGQGHGSTLNVPMPAFTKPAAYLDAFDAKILPELQAFAPQAVLISAGFDAHKDDPLASVQLESRTFYEMTERLCTLARELGHGRVLAMLEGGYDLDALAESVEEHLKALLDASTGASEQTTQ